MPAPCGPKQPSVLGHGSPINLDGRHVAVMRVPCKKRELLHKRISSRILIFAKQLPPILACKVLARAF